MTSAVFIGNCDVSELSDRLSDDSLFDLHDWRKEKYAHKEMKDIWVRYNHISNLGDGFNDEHDSVWYPIINKIPEVLPIVFNLMAAVAGERLGGILITKLPPGGKIARHIDEGWHAGYYDKFYVAVKNENGSMFCWDDIKVEAKRGDIWQFDNSVPHWVENNSGEDRIAMIVCIRTAARGLNEISRL